MESSVEEQLCLFYKRAKMKSEPVKKCQEKTIVPYIVFSFLHAIFMPISFLDCMFRYQCSKCSFANAWHLFSFPSHTSHLPTSVKCSSGLTQQNKCQKTLSTRAIIAWQYEPRLLNYILSGIWAIWKYK